VRVDFFVFDTTTVTLNLRIGNEDTQKAPWGTVALVQTRQIHTHSHALLYRSLAQSVRGGGSRGDRKPGKGTFGTEWKDVVDLQATWIYH
jgi:hypothetical protein